MPSLAIVMSRRGVANRVQLCTSLDGPADLHNKTRIFTNGNSHEITLEWIHKVNNRYIEMGLGE